SMEPAPTEPEQQTADDLIAEVLGASMEPAPTEPEQALARCPNSPRCSPQWSRPRRSRNRGTVLGGNPGFLLPQWSRPRRSRNRCRRAPLERGGLRASMEPAPTEPEQRTYAR